METVTTYINDKGVLRNWKHSELTEATRAIFKKEKPEVYYELFEKNAEQGNA